MSAAPAADPRPVDAAPAARAPITVFVITLNEERHIRECLESVAWADHRLVVDSHSTDRTCEIAQEMGATVVRRTWDGINAQRQAGLEHCATDWVLTIDADERVTPELRDEILKVLERPERDAYEIPRRTWHFGRWILHCGWYPDLKLRLFRKSRGRFAGTDPHDRFVPITAAGRLRSDLLHFSYRDFAHQIRTINAFSDTASAKLAAEGKSFSLLALLVKPPWKFVEVWILKQGFLDGLAGFAIAVASAFNVFSRLVKLRERTTR